MPLYEYECEKCGKHFEKIEKVEGPHLRKCPNCGGKVERLMSPPAIQFKGSGWYVTDYGRSGSHGAEKKDGAAGEAKADSKAESKAETKGASEAKDSKEKAVKEK